MTIHLRRSRPTVDADRLKSQAAELGGALSGASARAGQTASQLAHAAALQARDAAGHAKEWAAPRAEKAWYESRRATAPKVERAAEKALPLVDKTHDRLVDDVLPKLLAAVNAAAAATAISADRARDVTSAKLTDLAHINVPEPKKSHTGAKVFWSIAGLAVVGAVIAAFRRSRPLSDPWAEEPWEAGDRDAKARLGNAADTVGETAGHAIARTKEASERVAERAREATRKATARRRAEGDVTATEALPVTDEPPVPAAEPTGSTSTASKPATPAASTSATSKPAAKPAASKPKSATSKPETPPSDTPPS